MCAWQGSTQSDGDGKIFTLDTLVDFSVFQWCYNEQGPQRLWHVKKKEMKSQKLAVSFTVNVLTTCLCFSLAESCLVLSFLCCWGTVWWHHHAFVHQYSWKGAKKLWWIHSVQEDDVSNINMINPPLKHLAKSPGIRYFFGAFHPRVFRRGLWCQWIEQLPSWRSWGSNRFDKKMEWKKSQRGEVYAIVYWVDYVHIVPIDYRCSIFSASSFCSKNHLQ